MSFPDTNRTLKKIIAVFEGEEIHLAPALKSAISRAKDIPAPLVGDLSHSISSTLVGDGKGEGYNFQDLKRELLSENTFIKL